MTNIELLTPDKIIKSKRKSISLIIKNDGEFVVRAPIKCADKDILNFINKKAEWIIKKRVEQKQNSTIEKFLKFKIVSLGVKRRR